jgi:superfamily II DNA/RNA helicase
LFGIYRDHKLLKKIEKFHKLEKKIENRLELKLEKLESKKRRLEKKLQSKSCSEQFFEKKMCSGTRKRTSDGPVCMYLMDAIPLNDGPKPAETHIRLGERFTKVWEIMNSGTLPWTDKVKEAYVIHKLRK